MKLHTLVEHAYAIKVSYLLLLLQSQRGVPGLILFFLISCSSSVTHGVSWSIFCPFLTAGSIGPRAPGPASSSSPTCGQYLYNLATFKSPGISFSQRRFLELGRRARGIFACLCGGEQSTTVALQSERRETEMRGDEAG